MKIPIQKISLVLSVFSSLVFLSCKKETPPSHLTNPPKESKNTPNINTASVEHKRAALAILHQVANNTAPAGRTTASPNTSHFFQPIREAHAQMGGIPCTHGGTYNLDIVSGADSLEMTGIETGGLLLKFNNYAVKVTFQGCRQTHLMPNCAAPYQLDGLFSLTINGDVNRNTHPPHYNVTGRAITQGECSGLRVDTSNDLGQPRNMGLNLTNRIQGNNPSAPSIQGIVCIDNIQYPVEPNHLTQLQQELCGNRS